jgi:radical SAM superfamily enzyme YgiQ (UPF0313 family)
MRVLFINPWLKTLFGDEKARPGHPNLGLAYLIAVLKQNGIDDIDVFDQGLEDDDEVLFKKISRQKPDLIGITTFSYCFNYAMALIKEIKKFTNTPVIVGGPHVSAVKQEILYKTAADFAMKGESEASFLKFIIEFGGSRDFASVGNLIGRSVNGTTFENDIEPLIKDVDRIPLPSYEIFRFERYNYYTAKTAPIITSRGCPYGCNYCSVKLSMGREFRPRSPENVVNEMKYMINTYGIERFEINDDCFNLDIDRAESICDLIRKENLNITYELYNGIRPDRVTERLLQKMKDSGCVFVSYGCESGNQDVVNGMGKALRIDKVKEAVVLTNKVGIKNSVNFIIGHKDETYDTAMESIKFARTLSSSFVNFYNIIPYPGTKLFEWVSNNASSMLPVDGYLCEIGSRDLEPVFETKEFPRAERIKALKQGYALYERTVLRFRLGRAVGFIAYLASRNRRIFSIGRRFVLSNKIGFRFYNILVQRSRRK